MRSGVVVVATLIVDAVLFAVNLAVALEGGSRAVLSQAVYAITDLVGGALILWGIVASNSPPNPRFPFGRGKERFFWAFSAGLVTFSLAGSLVAVSGLLELVHPVPLSDLPSDLAAVAATLVAAGASLSVIFHEVRREGQTVSQLLESHHQGMKTIFLQDVVSVAGAVVALTGIGLVAVTSDPRFDGIAATIVGGLLLVTGFALAAETRELLVGRAMSVDEGRAILSLVERYPFVRGVLGMQSMLLGPDDVLVTLRVNFVDGLTTDDIEMHIDHLRFSIRSGFPQVRHLIIEPVSERPRRQAIP